jgi:cytochrome c peroxidase
MPFLTHPPMRFFPVAVALLLSGCGGGGAGGSVTPNTVPAVNHSPVVAKTLDTQTATVASAFSLDTSQGGTTFTDSDGDALTYSISITPSGSGLAATAAVVSGTPTTAGSYIVAVTAADAKGGSISTSFSITVLPQPGVPILPATAFSYSDGTINLPAQFRTGAGPGAGHPAAADNTPTDNVVSNAGATLGRVLFYDKRLSVNDTVSCASCHVQANGFGDTRRFSVGFQGGLTMRHSMGLANARYYQNGRFFWDERAASAEVQVLQPIQNSTEMGSTLAQVVTKLSAQSFYAPLFTAAFGDATINSDRTSRALAQFVRSMVSYRSKYDSAFVNGVANFGATLTAQEEQGRQLFEGAARCDTCHGTVAHVADSAKNNGLDAIVTDVGAGGGRFKVPSLRNIALRAPYMHDGRFSTLDQVVQHYDSGVQDSPNLAPGLRAADGSPRRLNLTATQRQALVAFLGTLSDTALTTDLKFADPFPLAR